MERVLLVVVALAAGGALADDVAVAREAFSKGQAAYAAGQYRVALDRFEESFKAKPHPSTIFNIARCQDQLGDFAKAMTSYKEYLRLAPQAADADQVGKAIVSLETRLQAKGLQHVLVYADPATAQIVIDEANVGASPAGAVLKPGTHTLKITAPGYDEHVRSFVVTSTRSSELTVSLRQAAAVARLDVPPPPPPPVVTPIVTDAPTETTPPVLTPSTTPEPQVATTATPAPRRRIVTWIAGGIGVAAAAVSVGMLIAMNGAVAELNRVDETRTRTRADSLVRDATLFGTVSTASAIGAGVAGVAAVVLFFLEGR